MELVDELLALAARLDADGVTYAVCGGLAVAIHGRPRLTIDIDLLVPAEQIPTARRSAAAVGFTEEAGWIRVPETGLASGRFLRLLKTEGEEFLTLDLLEADPEKDGVWQERVTVEVEGQAIRVVSKTALIAMKSGSQRTKDQLDIELLSDDEERSH